MCDYDWVNLAMANDSIVANLLLHFHNHPQPPPPPPSLQLHWTVRQPRSRPSTKPESSTRASPTTPLTWSATTSTSEESNQPTKLIAKTSRSKVRLLLSSLHTSDRLRVLHSIIMSFISFNYHSMNVCSYRVMFGVGVKYDNFFDYILIIFRKSVGVFNNSEKRSDFGFKSQQQRTS